MGWLSRLMGRSEPELVPCVYRLRVTRGRSGKRCEIELRSDQSFGELNQAICRVFDYDSWDHCSALFVGKVWNSPCLAEAHPDGSGKRQNLPLGNFRLEPGIELGYVYDFGDNITHTISVVNLLPIDPSTTYPIVAKPPRNRARKHKRQGYDDAD